MESGRGSPRAQHGENDESPRITVVGTVPEDKGSRDSPRARGRSRQFRARGWSVQSLSTKVVGTVPEHKDSRDSPRARRWSGQSLSTRIVTIVPEHEGGRDSPQAQKVWQKTICIFKPTGEAYGLNQPGIDGAIFFSLINARVPKTRARC